MNQLEYVALTQHEDYEVPAEHKADSWGRLPNGRIVAIDYGGWGA